ncbi:oxidoreductase [Pontibacter cellulosilyticus]|uniref:Oxidoreductase n=1 Tax=Pontibacter cellulosilyticus TaxID=1720253 RepID=A0A923N8C9_9BACT|nr:oxidoreductase [Pontibacter cellulosilyticus]MBC5993657.1 oxidoreductase [Pontibacter cellulosilyticus]
MQKVRYALIAGASGLVGSHCLDLLLKSDRYSQVISIGRRDLPLLHPKLEQRVVDFNKLQQYAAELAVDDVFCCLGTTIKKAGSKEAFYKVDHTYVVDLAKVTAAKGASQFIVISALGADASSMFFYNKVKGEMERDVQQAGFEAVHILRPSLLLGERTEQRTGEEVAFKLMKPLSGLMIGPLKKYKPIEAETVARAMLYVAAQQQKGTHIYPSDDIAALGAKL